MYVCVCVCVCVCGVCVSSYRAAPPLHVLDTLSWRKCESKSSAPVRAGFSPQATEMHSSSVITVGKDDASQRTVIVASGGMLCAKNQYSGDYPMFSQHFRIDLIAVRAHITW